MITIRLLHVSFSLIIFEDWITSSSPLHILSPWFQWTINPISIDFIGLRTRTITLSLLHFSCYISLLHPHVIKLILIWNLVILETIGYSYFVRKALAHPYFLINHSCVLTFWWFWAVYQDLHDSDPRVDLHVKSCSKSRNHWINIVSEKWLSYSFWCP